MSKRSDLKTYGQRGRSARVFIEAGGKMVRVQWRVGGQLKTQSFPNDAKGIKDARDYAQGVVESLERRERPGHLTTVAELWTRYSEHEFPNLRPRTQALNADAWRKWELVAARSTPAEDLGPETLATLRADLERQGLAVNTIARVVRGIKTVYNWGERHGVIGRNKLHLYRFKVGKDRKPAKVPEYRSEDLVALLAQMPLSGRNWRARGVLALCGYQGVRQNAARHLRWEDVDTTAQTIRWRPEWDKLGKDRRQPMRLPVVRLLESLRLRHASLGLNSPWVFPAPRATRDPVYSAQALWFALTEAERRAGITHKRGRGAHGLRRMLAGDVMALTGNLKTAGDAIGDTDLRILQTHYLGDRDDAVREAFTRLDHPETVTDNGNRPTGDGAK